MMSAAFVLLALSAQDPQTIDEAEFAADYAKVVRAFEAAGKLAKTSPAAALEALEKEILPRLPRMAEAVLVVKFSKGLTKGEEKERHEFFPYRLAAQCALAVDLPERALKYLEKSPSSKDLLERAKAALALKEKKATPPPVEKSAYHAAPFLEKGDFAGALEALRKERERVRDYDTQVKEVRDLAVRHEKLATANFAATLPRLNQPEFRKDHLEPCLHSLAGIPPDLETDELRWIRRLGEWLAKREPAGLDLLALEAAKFDPDFHVVCEQAQRDRLREVESLVDEARRAPRTMRQSALERLEAAERAFRRLSEARPYPDLSEALSRALARRPVDNEKLNEARNGVATVKEVRVLASQLDALWTSPEHLLLGDPDQRDLALYLGIYRSYMLFLDGKTVEEAAKDPRVIEVFRGASSLPKGISPKVASVLERVRSEK